MDSVKQCYSQLRRQGLLSLDGRPVESEQKVCTVEEYRQFWKPASGKTRVILLAESHRFTEDPSFDTEMIGSLLPSWLLDQGYPMRFVQLIYCLGCGENCLFDSKPSGNTGTPQFWKLLYACQHSPDGSHSFFDPILVSRSAAANRIETKSSLLAQLKRRGIWLLDASIVAAAGLRDRRGYANVLRCCWEMHIRQVLERQAPQHIVVVGHGVANVLLSQLTAVFGMNRITVMPQPQARQPTSDDRLKHLMALHNICRQHAPAPSS